MTWFDETGEALHPTGIGDHRWEGYHDTELAHTVHALGDGPGAESMDWAVEALHELIDAVADTERRLRGDLAEIGVTWQGEAADLAATITSEPEPDLAVGITRQGELYREARAHVPDADALSVPASHTDGFTGHGADHTQRAAHVVAARQAAIDALTAYTEGSRNTIGAHGAPVPPRTAVPGPGAVRTERPSESHPAAEHAPVRRFGMAGEDVFADERLVAPSVLGEGGHR